MFTAATTANPLMIENRPSVCMVVCIARFASFENGVPVSSTSGIASTVMASATTSWIT